MQKGCDPDSPAARRLECGVRRNTCDAAEGGRRDMAKGTTLSDLERRLIALLQQDSRRSLTDLAGQLGTSRTNVKQKMRRLYDAGIIKRFTVELGEVEAAERAPAQVFFHLRLKRPHCAELYDEIRSWPEIQGAWSLASSELDMLAHVAADGQDRIETLRDALARHPLVDSLHTTFVLKEWANKP
jgi:DNA-binding Lrp family transcriptional regulator